MEYLNFLWNMMPFQALAASARSATRTWHSLKEPRRFGVGGGRVGGVTLPDIVANIIA